MKHLSLRFTQNICGIYLHHQKCKEESLLCLCLLNFARELLLFLLHLVVHLSNLGLIWRPRVSGRNVGKYSKLAVWLKLKTWKLFVEFCWPVLDCCFKACAKYASPQDRPTCHTNKYNLSALNRLFIYSQIFTKNNSNAPGVSNFSHTSIIFSPLSRLRLVQTCSVGRFLPFYTLVNLGVSWFVKQNKTW